MELPRQNTSFSTYPLKILVDLIPRIYDTARIVRILGEDGSEEMVPLNQQFQDEKTGELKLYDVTVGKYDVEVSADGYVTYTGQARVQYEDMKINFELSEGWYDPICCWSGLVLVTVLIIVLLGLMIIGRRRARLERERPPD